MENITEIVKSAYFIFMLKIITKDFFIGLFVILAAIASLSASVGFLRFKKFFPKLHAISINDVLAVFFITIGLAIMAGFGIASFKIILLCVFAFFSGSVVTYALAKAAFMDGTYREGRE